MPRYFLQVSYDGAPFHGSQLQGDLPTVQLALNNALKTLLRAPVATFGASRTDEGVHALCNYYHFDWPETLSAKFVYNLNAILPKALAVRQMLTAKDPELNARFAAISRSYRYRIYAAKNPFLQNRALHYPFRLDPDLLRQTAAILLEYQDFAAFSKRNSQTRTMRCDLLESHWLQTGEEWQYLVRANRFLRGMVRGLVGTQLQVARGRFTPEQFREIIESGDCKRADFSVGGWGLYLEEVRYPDDALAPLI